VCNVNTSLLAKGASSVRKFFRPDMGSYLVGMDNHASCCMSPHVDMFVSLDPCPGMFVRGIKGKIPVTGKGTMKLKLQSDKGNSTEELIPESLYIPNLEMVLMCPQHWSQVANDHFPEPHGTWSYQQGEEFVMEWRQRTLRKTIPWDKRTNTARFYTAPDTRRYRAFAERFDVKNRTSEKERVCYEAHTDWDANVISEDETDGGYWADAESDEETVTAHNTQRPRAHEENLADLFQNTPGFKARPAAIIDEDLEKLSCQDPQTELLRWHYRLGHLSFRRIKRMAELGILPRKLAEVNPPKCAGCLFGTMKNKPWRNKGKSPKGVGHLATAPGQMVSVDQLESSAAGFISQLKGKLTSRRYKAATIFVDNF
jgi:hypothetical protein